MPVRLSKTEDAFVWGPVVAVVSIALANLVCYALNEHSWVFRRCLRPLGVPRMLFISNRSQRVTKQARPASYWGFDLLDPEHLVHAPLLGTAGVLVLHACTFLYFAAAVIVDVGIDWYGLGCHFRNCYQRTGGYAEWMSYLTNWSLSILGIAGLVGFINTTRYAHRRRRCRKAAAATAAAGGDAGHAAATGCGQHTHAAAQQVELRPVHTTAHTNAGTMSCPAQPQPSELPTASTKAPGSAQPDAQLVGHPSSDAGFRVGDQHSRLAVVPAAATPAAAEVPTAWPSGAAAAPHAQHAPGPAVQAATLRGSDSGSCDSGSNTSSSSNSDSGRAGGVVGSSPQHCSSGSGSRRPCDTVVLVCAPNGSGSGNGSPTSSSDDPCKPSPAKWDTLSVVHCLLMEVATTAAFFVSFWFWVGLGPIAGDDFNTNAGTIMAHAGNLGIALLQLLLTRLPMVSTHFQVLLWYATLYEVFLWSFGEGSGTWRYGLDFRKSRPAAVFILLPLIVFFMFAIWYLLATAREAVLRRATRARRRRAGHIGESAAEAC